MHVGFLVKSIIVSFGTLRVNNGSAAEKLLEKAKTTSPLQKNKSTTTMRVNMVKVKQRRDLAKHRMRLYESCQAHKICMLVYLVLF